MLRNSIINIVLKTGLSISLLYTALAAFIVPAKVINHWPAFVANRISEGTLSTLTGIACIAIIVWLFSGKNKFISVISLTILIALVGLFNIMSVSFLFSLSPLFFIALALSLRYYPRVRIVTETMITPLKDHSQNRDENSSNSQSIKDIKDNDIPAESK